VHAPRACFLEEAITAKAAKICSHNSRCESSSISAKGEIALQKEQQQIALLLVPYDDDLHSLFCF